MNEHELDEALAGFREATRAEAPERHRLMTDACPSPPRMVRLLRDSLKSAAEPEQRHMRGCEGCQMNAYLAFKGERPKAALFVEYARDPLGFPLAGAMKRYLEHLGAWGLWPRLAARIAGGVRDLAVGLVPAPEVVYESAAAPLEFRLHAEGDPVTVTLRETGDGAVMIEALSARSEDAGRTVDVEVIWEGGSAAASIPLAARPAEEGGCSGARELGRIEDLEPLRGIFSLIRTS